VRRAKEAESSIGGSMNKKQKILTAVALVAFLTLAICHYYVEEISYWDDGYGTYTPKQGTYLQWTRSRW
jgi:hypothetical protein